MFGEKEPMQREGSAFRMINVPSLLLFLVRVDFQLSNVRFWVWGLDVRVHTN